MVSGFIRGVAFGERGLIRDLVFGEKNLIKGMALGDSGLIRGVLIGESGLIRGVAFGESGLIGGVFLEWTTGTMLNFSLMFSVELFSNILNSLDKLTCCGWHHKKI